MINVDQQFTHKEQLVWFFFIQIGHKLHRLSTVVAFLFLLYMLNSLRINKHGEKKVHLNLFMYETHWNISTRKENTVMQFLVDNINLFVRRNFYFYYTAMDLVWIKKNVFSMLRYMQNFQLTTRVTIVRLCSLFFHYHSSLYLLIYLYTGVLNIIYLGKKY